jgi:lambda family phage tail tape measure protein
MASKSLGTLTLDLVARIGGYTAGLDKAEKEAQKRAKAIENAFDSAAAGVGIAFGAIATAGAAAFAAISQGIEEAAKFQDLAEMTGGSAEGLASMAVAAKTAGVEMDSIAQASIKLTKNLTGVDDESKAAGAALKALGIPLQEFKKLAPEQQIDELTKAFAGFADGTGKTAVALDLWGKSGAEQLKVMKALEEQGGRNVILTAEQIRQADEFADRMAKTKAELGLYASALATQAVPAVTAFMGALTDTIKEILGVGNAANALKNNTAVADFAEGAVRALGFVVDAVDGVIRAFQAIGTAIGAQVATVNAALHLDIKGAANIAVEGVKDVQAILDRPLFSTKLNQRIDEQKRLAAQATPPGAALPPLKYSGATKAAGGGSKDDPTKKLLENDLKAFKAQGDAAKELLADRNKILDLYNSQGLISVKDYYEALRGNAEEATAAQRKALDDQIKALQDFQAKAPKATDKADAQGKINDLLVQQAKLERESGNAAIEMGIKQQQATQAYRDSLNEVNAKILELDGNLGKAAEIRFDAQNRSLRALAQASGDFASVAQIDRLREYTKAQADLNGLQQKFSLAQGDLQIAEERITIARERGTMGEIESLKASGQARREAVAIMEKQLAAFQAIDAAARSPEQEQAIERLKVQLEGLKATVDPLADKFNTLFSDAAGSALGDFVTGTKTAKEAFRDFANTVVSEITRMAAKDLAKSIFGGGGSGGFNFGSLLSGLFGGGSSGGGGDALGAFISAKGFALGGFTGMGAANDPAGIVHKGEYVLTAEQTKRIGVSNLDKGNFGGGTVVNINQSFAAGTDRKTTDQAARSAQMTFQRAAGRNS